MEPVHTLLRATVSSQGRAIAARPCPAVPSAA